MPPLFTWLQQHGQVTDAEMHRVFNCGIGMAVVVAESGIGKSRLVQALYQQLTIDPAWDPPEVNYWPDAFQTTRPRPRPRTW